MHWHWQIVECTLVIVILDLLDKVLSIFKNAGLTLNPQKCHLFTDNVQYTGFLVSSEGLKITNSTTLAIKEWPEPVNLKELQKFLGFTNFYRDFIGNFSHIDCKTPEFITM